MDIEKRIVQAVTGHDFADYFDQGWYTCVAKNGLGVVHQDTYLTVASEQGQWIGFTLPL